MGVKPEGNEVCTIIGGHLHDSRRGGSLGIHYCHPGVDG